MLDFPLQFALLLAVHLLKPFEQIFRVLIVHFEDGVVHVGEKVLYDFGGHLGHAFGLIIVYGVGDGFFAHLIDSLAEKEAKMFVVEDLCDEVGDKLETGFRIIVHLYYCIDALILN